MTRGSWTCSCGWRTRLRRSCIRSWGNEPNMFFSRSCCSALWTLSYRVSRLSFDDLVFLTLATGTPSIAASWATTTTTATRSTCASRSPGTSTASISVGMGTKSLSTPAMYGSTSSAADSHCSHACARQQPISCDLAGGSAVYEV